MILDRIVNENEVGKTLKYVLKNELQLSERLIKKLKLQQKIYVNEHPERVNYIVQAADRIKVILNLEEECEHIEPQDIPLDIIYEDECMLVLNKQPNIVVHPTSYHPHNTIANGIVFYLKQKGITKKVRPVSRLDRETSGIIIFAKNQFTQEMLIRQMHSNLFKKEYLGVVQGIPEKNEGTINLPIARKPDSIMLRHISEEGAPSITHYKVLKSFPLHNSALLEFKLETGRTHQIRVHCHAMGFPIYGDTLYSENTNLFISRQALHSYRTEILHPVTRKEVIFTAELPSDIAGLLEILSK
ncbi:RluA family pseudouridine synthase [Ruminiclostridium josui]|uniref:RluA family pseudouridine synthase n=1 Tax=Ruminiclostridium josui TaxID=1499 RepID=UPI0004648BE3|nr:RluA family pseudouridine synthase [Ruminiclostridium josui]